MSYELPLILMLTFELPKTLSVTCHLFWCFTVWSMIVTSCGFDRYRLQLYTRTNTITGPELVRNRISSILIWNTFWENLSSEFVTRQGSLSLLNYWTIFDIEIVHVILLASLLSRKIITQAMIKLRRCIVSSPLCFCIPQTRLLNCFY